VHGRRNPFVAQEGILPMALIAAIGVLIIRYSNPWLALIPGVLFVLS